MSILSTGGDVALLADDNHPKFRIYKEHHVFFDRNTFSE